MLLIARKRQLKWFGHVTIHSDKLPLANSITHGRPPGERERDRPRISWLQNTKSHTGLSAREAIRPAQDRMGWRQRVEDSTVLLRSFHGIEGDDTTDDTGSFLNGTASVTNTVSSCKDLATGLVLRNGHEPILYPLVLLEQILGQH